MLRNKLNEKRLQNQITMQRAKLDQEIMLENANNETSKEILRMFKYLD